MPVHDPALQYSGLPIAPLPSIIGAAVFTGRGSADSTASPMGKSPPVLKRMLSPLPSP